MLRGGSMTINVIIEKTVILFQPSNNGNCTLFGSPKGITCLTQWRDSALKERVACWTAKEQTSTTSNTSTRFGSDPSLYETGGNSLHLSPSFFSYDQRYQHLSPYLGNLFTNINCCLLFCDSINLRIIFSCQSQVLYHGHRYSPGYFGFSNPAGENTSKGAFGQELTKAFKVTCGFDKEGEFERRPIFFFNLDPVTSLIRIFNSYLLHPN